MAKKTKSLFEAPGFNFDPVTGTLSIKHGGTIAITENADGSWTYTQGANSYSIAATQVSAISTIHVGKATHLELSANAYDGNFEVTGPGSVNLSGLSFVEADQAADWKFEPNINIDGMIQSIVTTEGVKAAFDALNSLTTEANAFKLLWDALDDNYTYYNTAVNDAFIDLGLIYADYLKNGGQPLNDTIVKYVPDGPDADEIPERLQTLHDNILGNFDELSIMDKFGTGASAIFDRIEDAGHGEILGVIGNTADGRGIYSGNDHDSAGLLQTQAFDATYFGM